MSHSIPVGWRHRLSAVSDLSVQEPSSFKKQIVRGLTTAAGIWATAGIGLAVGAGMYTIGIAATVLTLVGLELLSYLFKSIGMKSSMVSFSTPNKDILKQIADRFNSKDYLIVSYEMETQHTVKQNIIRLRWLSSRNGIMMKGICFR